MEGPLWKVIRLVESWPTAALSQLTIAFPDRSASPFLLGASDIKGLVGDLNRPRAEPRVTDETAHAEPTGRTATASTSKRMVLRVPGSRHGR